MSSSFDFGRAKQDLTEAVQNTRVREKAQGALVAHCYIGLQQIERKFPSDF